LCDFRAEEAERHRHPARGAAHRHPAQRSHHDARAVLRAGHHQGRGVRRGPRVRVPAEGRPMTVTPDFAYGFSFLGHTDQGGRPDGCRVMVEAGFAYIAHAFSGGFSIVDVRDPRLPEPVGFVAAPPGTWSVHLQAADGLLLVVNAKDLFADSEFA